MLEEIIGYRSPVTDGNSPRSLRDALERVRGTGLAMLRGWHVIMQRSPVTIRVTPQRAVRINSFRLPSAEAANWSIHNIRISNVDRLEQPIPGDMFAFSNQDVVVLALPDVPSLTPIEIDVEYIGGMSEGAVFRAVFMCSAVEEVGIRTSALIPVPIDSVRPIRPASDDGIRAWIQLDDELFRFEGRDNRLDRIVREAQLEVGLVAAVAEPRMISLHVVDLPFVEDAADGDREIVLFGIDDATSRVVFELGDMLHRPKPGAIQQLRFAARCDLAGYVPEWWDHVQLLEEDLRESIVPTGS